MKDDFRELDQTELIDVSDVEPNFDDEPLTSTLQERDASRAEMASIKDRFAAFLIDFGFIYTLYWVTLAVFRYVAMGNPAGPIPLGGLNGLLFHGIFLFLAILYFAIPEMAFLSSIGKAFCHITIRKKNGSYPSFMSIVIRNIFKPIDLILYPFMITSALMEWSRLHRRLGDVFARTVVLKKLSHPPRQHALSLDVIASTTARVFAFVIDFALLTMFAFGLALSFRTDEPLFNMLLLVLSPFPLLIFLILPEWLTKTSPGKWIWGFVVCHEDGTAVTLQSVLVRTLWKPCDISPIGFLTSLFSVRHQRSGDTAASTVVIKAPREWRGLIGLVSAIIVSVTMLYVGLQNRDSFLSGDFKFNFLPAVDLKGFGVMSQHQVQANLIMKNFVFAVGDPSNQLKPPIYHAGETLYLSFEIDGFARENTKVWLKEDLLIRYPDNSQGLKLENINEIHRDLEEEGPVKFENNIAIPPNSEPGRYTINITIKDEFARQELKEQRFFYITQAEAQTAPPTSIQNPSPTPDNPQAAPPPNPPDATGQSAPQPTPPNPVINNENTQTP